MIEKLLKPFISDHAKLILEAMEKVGGDPEKMDEYWLKRRYATMYDAAKDSEGIISRVVLTRAYVRLDSACKIASARAYAADFAAKILLGTSFKPEEEEKTGSQSAAMNQALAMSIAGNQSTGMLTQHALSTASQLLQSQGRAMSLAGAQQAGRLSASQGLTQGQCISPQEYAALFRTKL